ncbi:MAG: hypothetical protein M3N47_10735 [Chloroflexota bacterium]|nr:hypothetical protein [Chloroflexota bacterium]
MMSEEIAHPSERTALVQQTVERGVAYLDQQGYALGTAWVRHLWHDAPADAVIDALAAYQYEDGGFGNGLEVDIKAPVSNPFAARLAMTVLVTLREPSLGPVVDGLDRWLTTTQHADGDWHFAPEIYQHGLAPWFAGWTFPSLNPACCLAGLAARLGLGSDEMQARVRRLFDEKASLDEARTGEFYNLLPYLEYLAGVDHPDRDQYLDALAANITATAERGGYADAGHFFEHAHGGGPDLLRRLPTSLIQAQTERLLAEPEEDGGWPSPYDPAWRPWATAANLALLADLQPAISPG